METNGTNAPSGWFVGYAGRTNLTTVGVSDGSLPPDGSAAWNFGSVGDPDRALGTMATSVGSPSPNDTRWIEARIQNRTGQSLNRLTIFYDGEQWRTATTATNTTLVLQYSLDGVNFENAGAAFNFTQPTQIPLNSALDGNQATNRAPGRGGTLDLPAFIPPDGIAYLRWFDVNDVGTTDPALAIDNFSFSASASGAPPEPIAYTGGTLTETFDGMGATGTTTPPGWVVGYAGPSDQTTVAVNDGGIGPNQNAGWNFGVSNDVDRALGTMPTTTGTPTPPAGTRFVCTRIRNNTGRPIHRITVFYDGEQWRTGSTESNANSLVLRFSADGLNYVDMGSAFNFTQPTFTPLNNALDGNQAANRRAGIGGTFDLPSFIPPDGIAYLRWFDANESGADPALAIDNFSFVAGPFVNCACLDMLPELHTNACQGIIPDLCQLYLPCLELPGVPLQCAQSPAAGGTVGPGTHPITVTFTHPTLPPQTCVVNFVVTAPTNCCVEPSSLPRMVAWWPLDETTGATQYKDLAGANDALIEQGPLGSLNSPAAYSNGKVAGASWFFLSGNHGRVSPATTLNFDTRSFSVDCWFQANLAPGDLRHMAIVDKFDAGSGAGRGYRVSINLGQLQLRLGDGVNAPTYTASTLLVPGSTWVFIGVAVDRNLNQVRFQVDGAVEIQTLATVGNPIGNIDSTVDLLIGEPISGHTDHLLDEVEMFDSALMTAEFDRIRLAGSAGKCKPRCVEPSSLPRMVAWWPLDEGTTATMYKDLAGANDALIEQGPLGSPNSPAAYPNGKVAGASWFFVSGDHGRAPNAPALNFGTGSFSVDCWFQAFNLGPLDPRHMAIVDKFDAGSGAGKGYRVSINQGKLELLLGGTVGGPTTYTCTLPVPGDAWVFIGVSVDRGTANAVTFQINSTVVPAVPLASHGNIDSSIDLLIGEPISGHTDHLLDEVELFDSALTTAQFDRIRLAGSAGKCKPVCVPPPANMVLWLPLDETAGLSAQNLAGGNNGVHVNGPSYNLGSHVANSLCFDAVDDYVQVASYPALGFGTGDFSMDAWVKVNAASFPGRVIVSHREVLTSPLRVRGYVLFLWPDNSIAFQMGDGNANWQNFNSTLIVPLDNRWHHVAVTVQRSGAITAYLDGTQVQIMGSATLYPGSVTPPPNIPLYVGGDTVAPNATFNGCIDEVELFSRVLTQAEIHALWKADSAGKCKTNYCLVALDCRDLSNITTNLLCGTNCVPVLYPTPPASGNCPPITVVCVPPSGQCLPPGVHTVTCTATDAQTNTAQCSFTVTVLPAPDTTPPTLDCDCLRELAASLLFTNGCPAYVPDLCQFTNCFSDTCCLPTNACSQTPPPGTPVGPGTHPITIKITDCAGHMTNCLVDFVVTCPPPCNYFTNVCNTGRDSNGLPLAPGQPDPFYTLVSATPASPCNGPAQAVTPNPGWIPNGPNSSWIGPGPNSGNPGCQPGVYHYRRCFYLPCTNDASITGQWSVDNSATMYLNGQLVSSLSFASLPFTSLHPVNITSGFVCGTNCLDFYVTNAHDFENPTGFRAQLTNVFNDCCCPPPSPVQTVFSGMDLLGVPLPLGVPDAQFALTCAPPGVTLTTPITVQPHPLWVPNSLDSQWIGVDPSNFGPPGVYCYQLQFNIPCPPGTHFKASLTGQWTADDFAEMHLNGQSTGHTVPSVQFPTVSFTGWHPINITSGFQSGLNTLTFYVTNAGGPTGLRLELTNSFACCDCTNNCDAFPPLVLTCPPSRTSNTCFAPLVVNYTPTVTGGGPPVFVSCTPPSGTAFGYGTHTVTCTASDRCTTTNCSFTVTVKYAGSPPCVPPNIVLDRVGANLVLSWPAEADDVVVEATDSLTPPVVWQRVTATVQEANGRRYVTLPCCPGPQRFYRLASAPTTACDWSQCDTNSPLAGRFEHTAVWIPATGEWLIWGGNVAGTLVNNGARYNPATGVWTPMSTVNAPSARYRHVTARVGNEMIVWGGLSANFLNDGGRYNPATDTWTPISTVGAPVARHYASAVTLGNEMCVWGGRGNSGNLDTGGRYNPANNTWTALPLTGAPSPRLYHGAAAATSTGEMLIWGGADALGVLNDGARYNPSTDAWTPISATGAPSARSHFPSIWTGTEMIIWSGAGAASVLNTGARYNPATDTWATMTTVGAPAAIARFQHAAAWNGSQMITWGGWNGGAPNVTGGCYDPAANTWTVLPITGAPPARYDLSMAWTGTEVLFWGGRNANNVTSVVAPDVWCFRKCP
jgi:N-acetylneuraminic acid mutarotase